MTKRYVMHVWSNGHATIWNTRDDEMFRRIYGPDSQSQLQIRECTRAELMDAIEEQTRFGNMDNVAQARRQLRAMGKVAP
jgi:hypothetical protein